MKKPILFLTMLFLVTSATFTSCSKADSAGEGTEQDNLEGNGEGSEGGGGEQGESGTRFSMNQTADEVISGIHAIISFDSATNSFVGTFENLNSNLAQQSRLEVHVFDASGNSTEFGPTPGVDMQPGETRNLSLPITGSGYTELTMHPEVGTAGSGG